MVWFKVDDGLAFHPKVMAAGLPAMGLWVRAGAWSAFLLTDGVVTPEIVASIGDPRQVQAKRLVDVGLWVPGANGCYAFHEWDLRQPSRAEVQALQEARGEAGKEANHIRWHVNRGITRPDCPWCQPVR